MYLSRDSLGSCGGSARESPLRSAAVRAGLAEFSKSNNSRMHSDTEQAPCRASQSTRPSVAELRSNVGAQHFPAAEQCGFSSLKNLRLEPRSTPMSNETVYGKSTSFFISTNSTFTRTTTGSYCVECFANTHLVCQLMSFVNAARIPIFLLSRNGDKNCSSTAPALIPGSLLLSRRFG